MNGESDASDHAPLNTQAAAEGSYGSTSTINRASSSQPRTDGASLTIPDGRRADGSLRNTSTEVSQIQRLVSTSSTSTTSSTSSSRSDAVQEDRAIVLSRRELLCVSVVDVALIAAGTSELVLHWDDEARRCLFDEVHDHGGHVPGPSDDDLEEFRISESFRLWAVVAVELKVLITVARVVSSVHDGTH